MPARQPCGSSGGGGGGGGDAVTSGTLAALSDDETGRFLAAYEAELAAAYPVEDDGSVLFPFRRLFFVLTVEA